MQMFNSEQLQEKWAPLLDYNGLEPIRDTHRRAVTAILLENQEQALREEREFLTEGPTNSAGTGGFSSGTGSPVQISVIGSTVTLNVARIGSTTFILS